MKIGGYAHLPLSAKELASETVIMRPIAELTNAFIE
jgi:hypothetical protein